MARRRCLGCTSLTTSGSYCPTCKARRKQTYNGSEWQRIRTQQLLDHPRCAHCGATTDLTVDHIIPRSLAGGVQTLCRSCNGRKADRRT